MLIGQSIFAPTTPGAIYYTPWFPRQGDVLGAVIEVLKTSGGAFTLSYEVQTKNEEDTDAAVTVLGTMSVTATGTTTSLQTGCFELVRYKLTAKGTSSQQWIHFRTNPPQWQPN